MPVPTQPCRGVDNKATTTFKGVTVGQATNLKVAPKVTSKSSKPAAALECADTVVGKGAVAKPTSTVSVQYTGVLYSTGKQFDSSWARGGTPASFPLTGVIPGFKQAIGGAGKVAPMHVGGRRIIILPSSLAYGAAAQNGHPGELLARVRRRPDQGQLTGRAHGPAASRDRTAAAGPAAAAPPRTRGETAPAST